MEKGPQKIYIFSLIIPGYCADFIVLAHAIRDSVFVIPGMGSISAQVKCASTHSTSSRPIIPWGKREKHSYLLGSDLQDGPACAATGNFLRISAHPHSKHLLWLNI
jgi:hypothetical protein